MADQPTAHMKLTTPLGEKTLQFSSMTAVEELGRLFDFRLIAVSEKNDLNPNALLGKRVSIAVEHSNRQWRQFNGVVTSAGLEGTQGRLYSYALTLRPWLWLLSRRADTRIFQNKTVPQILADVFQPYSTDFLDKLKGTYPKLDFCVQYRETDLNFVSRLMEQEGIYYYFTHTAEQHVMVIADKPSIHTPLKGHDEYKYRPQSLGAIDYEAIDEWRFSHEIQPGKVTLNDHDFINPTLSLLASAEQSRDHVASKGEYYDPPGEYILKSEGDRYAHLRLEELQTRHSAAHGHTTATGLEIGRRFTLADHPRKDQNREHIVVATRIDMSSTGAESGEGTASYHCEFTALDSREVFRPQRITPKPVVAGPQTAVVVGPAGDEIYTDTHGRVKVQFFWDRLGKNDANSSCWIRVSHPWAGKGWGAHAVPRIGHEVVVAFLEGDPDRPIIVGSVQNGDNVTPYELPANATVSTMKSRSSKGGVPANFNELRFEDKKGSEHVWFQAEKDHFHLVKNDAMQDIGHDDFINVKNDRKEKIGGMQHLHVVKDAKHKIDGGLHSEIANDMLFKVGGDQGAKVTGDASTDANGSISLNANNDVHIKAGTNGALQTGVDVHIKAGVNVVIEAGVMITLKAGSNSVVISPTGVSITGTMVLINSGGGTGSGNGANPVQPTAPESPEDPKDMVDPLPSR